MSRKTPPDPARPPVTVFVTDELPRPGSAGHLAFNHAIISWLVTQGHRPHILLTGKRLAWPVMRYGAIPLAGPHIQQIGPYVTAISPTTAGPILARAALRALPASMAQRLRRARHQADAVLGGFLTPADLRWCARAIARLKPQAVLIDTIFRAPLLAEPELAGCNGIIITHDLFHRRAQVLGAAGYQVRPGGLTRAREAELLSRARAIAAIQPDEAAEFRQMCTGQTVFTTPMPALPCPRPSHIQPTPGRLAFIGSATLPNLDGLRWFFAEIWPQLAPQGVTLDLVGTCGLALHHLPPGVRVLGRVPSLAPILHRATLAIAPLRAGSGLKIKLLDYARHGLFTIATPPSLQGFAPTPSSPFIIAGSANMFAQAVLRHIESPPRAETALAYVAQHYSLERAFAGLRAALTPDEHCLFERSL